MARNSKRVANRIAVNSTVLASLRVHGAEVAPELQTLLFSGGRAGKLDLSLLLSRLADALEDAGRELAEADLAHAGELADDEGPRVARERATIATREKLLSLRELVSGAYGGEAARGLQLSEALPELPTQLVQRARSVAAALRSKNFSATPKHASLKLNLASLADELDQVREPLDAALSDVAREEREAQTTMLRKNRATEDWERVYAGVTHMAYGAYLLAGRPDLAERIEPTARKRAGVDAGPEGPTPPVTPPVNPAAPGVPSGDGK